MARRFRRKYRRRRKKFRRFRRRRRGTRRKMGVGFRARGFPRQFAMTLVYGASATLDPAAAAIAELTIRANGPQDPVVIGAGHQPRYFDQMSPLYERYRVVGAKIECKVVQAGTSQASLFGIILNNQPAVVDAQNDFIEDPSARHIVVGLQTGVTQTISHYFSLAKAAGREKNDDVYTAATTGLPEEQWYFHIGTFALNALDPSAMQFTFKVFYRVIFHDRLVPGES